MQIKRNNLHFMLFALLCTPLGLLFDHLLNRTGISGWDLGSVIAYLIFIGIGLLMLRKDEATFFDVLPVNVGLKPLTALLIVPLAFTMLPFESLLASVGGLIGGGDLLGSTLGTVSKQQSSFFEAFFTIAVIPSVFEEIFYRGFFYAGFKRARGAGLAIILTGILFGFFHGALQQVLYCSVVGIVLAILREVTGSMWAGFLLHLVNNGYNIVMKSIVGEATFAKFPLQHLRFFMTDGNTAGNLIYSYAMVIVGLALTGLILYLIIKREGRLEDAKHFFKRPDDPKEKVVTATLIIGCISNVLVAVIALIGTKSAVAMQKMGMFKLK